MRTCIFIPPLAKHTGGVAVLMQLAAHLHGAGREVRLVPRESGKGPGLAADAQAPVLPWDSLDLGPGDLWLVPEGWVNALAPGLRAKARCVVYCQNWAYLLAALPENVAWAQLPVDFLAVSQPVAWFVAQCTGRVAPVLRAAVDVLRFAPPEKKPDGPLRVAYMPRKNKALVQRVREITAARAALGGGPLSGNNGFEWVEISGLPQHEVAARLASCHVFLASGFPEGCPLPPLEAMASGCFVVGFAGFGGWDYMRQIEPALAYAAAPWWPENEPVADGPDAPPQLGGNGIWCADADVMALALGLEQAAAWKNAGDARFATALRNARATALCYSLERQRQRCLEIWDTL